MKMIERNVTREGGDTLVEHQTLEEKGSRKATREGRGIWEN